MKYILFLSLVLFACSKQQKSILNNYSSSDIENIFESENVNGCFIIYDLKNDKKLTFNVARLDSAFLPASTFKIINSMIALETGIVKDEKEIILWDGIDRGYDKWNMDQNLESGIKYSAVWFYQELARRIIPKQQEQKSEQILKLNKLAFNISLQVNYPKYELNHFLNNRYLVFFGVTKT